MISTRNHFSKLNILTASMVAGGMTLASCAAPRSSSPVEVETSRPSVTYKYNTDDELIQANHRAVTYCNSYNFVPQPANFSKDPDGRKVVVFDCVDPPQMAQPVQQISQNSSFNYRTDQELVTLSRNAQLYCMNNGNQQANSSIQSNMDGSKTVTFRCVR